MDSFTRTIPVTEIRPGMVIQEVDSRHRVRYAGEVLFVLGEYKGFANERWQNGERITLPGYRAWPQRITVAVRVPWRNDVGGIVRDGWNSDARVWA